jgi:hypothetical protein
MLCLLDDVRGRTKADLRKRRGYGLCRGVNALNWQRVPVELLRRRAVDAVTNVPRAAQNPARK